MIEQLEEKITHISHDLSISNDKISSLTKDLE